MHITEKEIDRFWTKVQVRGTDECWPWVAKAKHHAGYGVMRISSVGRNVVASRISCFLAYGPPPGGLKNALHSCDNPPCCNPNHLRWGTQKDNVSDAKERDRHVNPPDTHSNQEWNEKRLEAMPRGNGVWNQSLTEETAREIWRLHFEHKTASEIANIVGSTVHVVYDVCRGRSWQHLPDAPSIEDLKKGGVRRGAVNQFSNGGDTRSINPRTKIPSSEIPKILERVRSGETLVSIGNSYGVLKSAIWSIKKQHGL